MPAELPLAKINEGTLADGAPIIVTLRADSLQKLLDVLP
jgi:hypothetical protein